MDQPGLKWSGRAYLDSNRGTESLEEGFDVLALVARAYAGRRGCLLRGQAERWLTLRERDPLPTGTACRSAPSCR